MLTNDSDQDPVVNFFHWETDFDAIVLIDDNHSILTMLK